MSRGRHAERSEGLQNGQLIDGHLREKTTGEDFTTN